MQNSVLFNLIRKHHEAEELLWQELHRRNVCWKTYAKEGFKTKAIIVYVRANGSTYTDAKAAVEEYINSH